MDTLITSLKIQNNTWAWKPPGLNGPTLPVEVSSYKMQNKIIKWKDKQMKSYKFLEWKLAPVFYTLVWYVHTMLRIFILIVAGLFLVSYISFSLKVSSPSNQFFDWILFIWHVSIFHTLQICMTQITKTTYKNQGKFLAWCIK